MKQYTLYMTFYGKKLKTTVHALSQERAMAIVRGNISFDKIEEEVDEKLKPKSINDINDLFGGIFK
jgi:hypothetical protein